MIPDFKRLPGFVSYYGGVDRSAPRGIAVTIWDDMDHAAANAGRPSGYLGGSVSTYSAHSSTK
ncbi:MAG: hypothetical protein U0X20_33710, partial [Caldilineaceae bacterium]